MREADKLYDVALFTSEGKLYRRYKDLSMKAAQRMVKLRRPSFGGSYITVAGTKLRFKRRYPLGWYQPRIPSQGQATKKQLIVIAKRFMRDREAGNAAEILKLIADR